MSRSGSLLDYFMLSIQLQRILFIFITQPSLVSVTWSHRHEGYIIFKKQLHKM
jgi:hypothetical protein